MDCSPLGLSVDGILQARIPQWIAMPSSRGSFQPRYQTQVSRIAGGFFTVWATIKIMEWVAYPFSRGTSRSRNWIWVFGIAGGFFTSWATRKPCLWMLRGNKTSLLPAITTTNILRRLYSRAEVLHLSSACSFEQGSYKLVFGIATISGENNGFGIWSVNCKTLNKLFGEWWYGFIELL